MRSKLAMLGVMVAGAIAGAVTRWCNVRIGKSNKFAVLIEITPIYGKEDGDEEDN